MGDVKRAITISTMIAQQILPWLSVNAMAELSLNHHKRCNQYQLGLESVTSTASKNDMLTGDLGAKFGHSQYKQSYFGVTTDEKRQFRIPRLCAGFRHLRVFLERDVGSHFRQALGRPSRAGRHFLYRQKDRRPDCGAQIHAAALYRVELYVFDAARRLDIEHHFQSDSF